jgi:hypothetical protein
MGDLAKQIQNLARPHSMIHNRMDRAWQDRRKLIADALRMVADDLEKRGRTVLTLGWLYQEIADYRLRGLAAELDPAHKSEEVDDVP